jgi:hypothetical protein
MSPAVRCRSEPFRKIMANVPEIKPTIPALM